MSVEPAEILSTPADVAKFAKKPIFHHIVGKIARQWVRDKEEIEDVKQEILCSLLKKLKSPKPVDNLYAYVSTTALYMMRRRKKRRRPCAELPPEYAMFTLPVESKVAEDERYGHLQLATLTLPLLSRLTLNNTLYGVSLQEIAEKTGRPLSTTHRKRDEALALLKERLESPELIALQIWYRSHHEAWTTHSPVAPESTLANFHKRHGLDEHQKRWQDKIDIGMQIDAFAFDFQRIMFELPYAPAHQSFILGECKIRPFLEIRDEACWSFRFPSAKELAHFRRCGKRLPPPVTKMSFHGRFLTDPKLFATHKEELADLIIKYLCEKIPDIDVLLNDDN